MYTALIPSTWKENYAVYAGTTPNPDEMVELLRSRSEADYTQYLEKIEEKKRLLENML